MRVARLLLSARSDFDLKCFRLDREAAPSATDQAWSLPGPREAGIEPHTARHIADALRGFAPDVLHVYGSGVVPHSLLVAADAPWLADRHLAATRPLFGRSPRAQAHALVDRIAEPVADEYFIPIPVRQGRATRIVGSLRQSTSTRSRRDLVDTRIRRFRDDIEWTLFEAPPSASVMSALDLWVDLSEDEDALDGLVGEAIVLGLPVVATRTAANRRRTAEGRAGTLCPKRDPNEMAHAIVTLLFKPERATPLLAAAAVFREQFRTARRHEALAATYAEVAG